LKGFGGWLAFLVLALYLAKEFIGWTWWYHWEDAEDEENPAPFLSASWRAWRWLDDACSRLWWRVQAPWQWLRWRFFPPNLPDPPLDQDGRAPEEWLLVELVGIWNLEYWYKDEYDWQVKKKRLREYSVSSLHGRSVRRSVCHRQLVGVWLELGSCCFTSGAAWPLVLTMGAKLCPLLSAHCSLSSSSGTPVLDSR